MNPQPVASMSKSSASKSSMSKSSLALSHARGLAILLVVCVHSTLAYLQNQQFPMLAFASPPYAWRVIPIIDPQRWLGFDLFCALQYVLLMPFMFFLSGLFVWTSLSRRSIWTFLRDRVMRIGVPFIIGVYVLMPLAYVPVYRLGVSHPSWSGYWSEWEALPFWPSGPLWFLWQILVLDLAAAALFSLAPGAAALLARLSRTAGSFPARYCVVLTVICALGYLPLAAIFTPWDLGQFGPFAYFPSRLGYFAIFFFAGVGAGVNGIDAGLLRAAGPLPRRWALWVGFALVTSVAWMLLIALTIDTAPLGVGPIPHLDILANFMFALASTAACMAFAAIFLRFAEARWPAIESLSDHAYGIYLLHYPFVVWLQYFLLGVGLLAVAKGTIVSAGSLLASWILAAGLTRTSLGAFLIGAGRRRKSSPTIRQAPAEMGAESTSYSRGAASRP
jgi:peptidoglycan/LPS O-acetylase OafA/YrhL